MKYNLALLAGGDSGEHEISLKSAAVVAKNIDLEKFNVYIIVQKGVHWQYKHEDRWIEVDKNDFSLFIDGNHITFAGVFIIIHGTPGEDGKMQSYFDMIGMKYTTCAADVSLLTFNKAYCNAMVRESGLANVAKNVRLFIDQPYEVEEILQKVSLPVFVKPNAGGSSVGMSKVKNREDLQPAIEKAFHEDKQVLIEEYIAGRELSVGTFLYKNEIIPFPVTEIVPKTEFFDYDAKYKGLSDELTPAPIEDSLREQIQQTAKNLYAYLGCRGVVRFDFIVHPEKGIYFLEVNTTPGQSEQSIVPQQVRCMGWGVEKLYARLIEETLGI